MSAVAIPNIFDGDDYIRHKTSQYSFQMTSAKVFSVLRKYQIPRLRNRMITNIERVNTACCWLESLSSPSDNWIRTQADPKDFSRQQTYRNLGKLQVSTLPRNG